MITRQQFSVNIVIPNHIQQAIIVTEVKPCQYEMGMLTNHLQFYLTIAVPSILYIQGYSLSLDIFPILSLETILPLLNFALTCLYFIISKP